MDFDKTITINTGSSLTTNLGSYRILAYGTLTITGTGTITSSSSSSTVIVGETGTLTLNSATLKNTSTGTSAKAVHNNGGYVEIKSGKVTGTNIGIGSDNTASTTIIRSGTITGTNSYGVGTLGQIKVNGGTISGAKGILYEETATSLQVVDATVTATSNVTDDAAITMKYTGYMENVTANGGDVGILNNGAGTVTVKNCEVTATTYGIKSSEGGRFIITGTSVTSDYTGIIMHGGQLSVTAGCEIIGNGDNGVHYYENTDGYFSTADSIITGNVNGVFNHGSAEIKIISGTITGKTSAGVKNYDTATGTIYIGDSTRTLSTTDPMIYGGVCAVHSSAEGNIYYHNGALKYPTDGAVIYGVFKSIRLNHTTKESTYNTYKITTLVASTSTASVSEELETAAVTNNVMNSSIDVKDDINASTKIEGTTKIKETTNIESTENTENTENTKMEETTKTENTKIENTKIEDAKIEDATKVESAENIKIEATTNVENIEDSKIVKNEKSLIEDISKNNESTDVDFIVKPSTVDTELYDSSNENITLSGSTTEKIEDALLPEQEIAIKDDEYETTEENTDNSVQ